MTAPTIATSPSTPADDRPEDRPLPPGATGLDRVRALMSIARDPWFYTREVAESLGDVALLPVPFIKVVLLSHPDDLTLVNVKRPGNYVRADLITKTMRVQGSAHDTFALTTDEEAWSRGRKLLQPHFTQRAMVELGGLFTDAITDEVDSWGRAVRTGQPMEMHEPLKTLALAVLYSALFSRRLSAGEMHEVHEALNDRMVAQTWRTVLYPLPRWVRRPRQARGNRGDAWLDAHLAQLVAERRADPTSTTDVLNVLLDATYEDGRPIEDGQVRTEMLFLIIGGHETTAAALAWTFALLATHPEATERVYAEVDALEGRRVGPADMERLPFVRACFDEAQRLQGGLVMNPKIALTDDVIGGYRIPAGATVLNSNITLGRDPRFWGPDGDAFRPERWLQDGTPTAAFQNFSRGRRMCLGKRMAYMEAILTIATAYQRYRFTAPPGWQPRHAYQMSVGVKGGVNLRLEAR